MVLEQYAEEALERTEDRPMQHQRRLSLAVLVDVMGTEPRGQVQVHLQGAALPVAPDRIAQHELQLRSIEGALARVQRVFNAGGPGGLLERRLRLVPDRIAPDALGRPVGELDGHLVKAEV